MDLNVFYNVLCEDYTSLTYSTIVYGFCLFLY